MLDASEYVAPIDLSIKVAAYDAMQDLSGWCSEKKAAVLIDLILEEKPQIIVEIGVFGGKSLIPMAIALRELGKGCIYGIDAWRFEEAMFGLDFSIDRMFWSCLDYNSIYQSLLSKISDLKLQPFVILIQSSSQEASFIKPIDLLHLDGNHSDEISLLDVIKWTPFVRKGGLIVFSDPECKSQQNAVQWLDEHCQKEKKEESFAIWRKP